MSVVTNAIFFGGTPAVTGPLIDSFGRTVKSVRISVTDRCNFRCLYCMPEEGMAWSDGEKILSYEEISRVVRILSRLGVSRVRLTGGEPLLRKGLPELVAQLSAVPGLEEIALTTNGYFLAEQAGPLAGAGLERINVSLDSLDPEVFAKITRRKYLHRVLAGIAEARREGIVPVKLNVVLLRGVNDGEVGAFAALAHSGECIVRFIEFMPIGSGDNWTNDHVVTTGEVLDTITTLGYAVEPVPGEGAGLSRPADRYRFTDGGGELGFISSVSRPFCGSCDRIRLTADGHLRTCLFSLDETDLRGPLRGGASDADIAGLVGRAVARKEAGHHINRPGFVRPERTMSSIGG